MIRTHKSSEGHQRAVAVPRHCPKRASNHSGGVNREATRVKVAQTSSSSCSAGGVFGREGATDSAARRTIVEGRVVVRGKENAEFSVRIFGGKYVCRPGKESRIPKSRVLCTLSTGDRFRLHILSPVSNNVRRCVSAAVYQRANHAQPIGQVFKDQG